jgi:hypothetical protein
MQPVRYVCLTAIPRNASGKHDLLKLEAIVAQEQPQKVIA